MYSSYQISLNGGFCQVVAVVMDALIGNCLTSRSGLAHERHKQQQIELGEWVRRLTACLHRMTMQQQNVSWTQLNLCIHWKSLEFMVHGSNMQYCCEKYPLCCSYPQIKCDIGFTMTAVLLLDVHVSVW